MVAVAVADPGAADKVRGAAVRAAARRPTSRNCCAKARKNSARVMPGGFGGGRGIALVAIAGLVLWGLTGFYKVDPDEVGVVLRFGRFVGQTLPGLNYHLPSPIETVITPSVTRINRVELGYRSPGDSRRVVASGITAEESLMLTGDENIIDINFSVFWKIGDQVNDPEKYLFNIRDPGRHGQSRRRIRHPRNHRPIAHPCAVVRESAIHRRSHPRAHAGTARRLRGGRSR